MKKPPFPLDRVFHYANAKPTEDTWRRVVLGPGADLVLTPGAEAPKVDTWRVKSLEEFVAIRDEYRRVMEEWVRLESPYSTGAGRLVEEINKNSNLRFDGWRLSPTTNKLYELWTTENESFSELLYSDLAAALKEVPYDSIHGCEECGDFFYETSKAGGKFCSARCRNRATVRRHRAQKSEASAPKAAKVRGRPRKDDSRSTKPKPGRN